MKSIAADGTVKQVINSLIQGSYALVPDVLKKGWLVEELQDEFRILRRERAKYEARGFHNFWSCN
jgi:hypothetical protein